ncbi:AbrB/MazE/SpoVT family DNA-binding domain-containing protein [Pararhizobium sp.]|uniref:AbrB/MazE/SpoVT family DNA-binding domain-containing protein n=1 Tax=Pararhizobium sp. TaxID=1977563 RepID=UPI00271B9B94|nr:AbrB family transcriptional regulator [Pararhizobium sp.]MDO9416020.1 AbrB family transcriptional regulator [Pararhizobium sp.]
MKVTIRNIGGSKGVNIPTQLLNEVGVTVGDRLTVAIENGAITMRPVDETFERLEAARFAMDKYKVALKKLADS